MSIEQIITLIVQHLREVITVVINFVIDLHLPLIKVLMGILPHFLRYWWIYLPLILLGMLTEMFDSWSFRKEGKLSTNQNKQLYSVRK